MITVDLISFAVTLVHGKMLMYVSLLPANDQECCNTKAKLTELLAVGLIH
jgi:hypothetical protein